MQPNYTRTKLETKFNIKDKTKKEHHHVLTLSVKYPVNCLVFYDNETGRKLIERVNNTHNGKDINSHMFKHSIAANHPAATLDNFTVLGTGYRNRKFKRNVSEFLLIKQNRPTLNKHGTSVSLKLFN